MLTFAAAFTSCSESLLLGEDIPQVENKKIPLGYIPVGDNSVFIVFDDETEEEMEWKFRLTVEDTIKVGGNQPVAPAEELSKKAEEVVTFAYNYGIKNVVKANIVVDYVYNGKTYRLNCLEADMMTVSGSHSAIDSVESPYYELSETEYILDFDGIELASATQVFVVEEGYVPPVFERTEWSYAHEAFRRAAIVNDDIITVVCDNVANFADIYSDGSKKNEEEVSYTVSNKFDFNAPVLKVDELSTVVGKTFSFSNGVVTVADQTVSAVWKSASVDDKVMHGEKDYASEITPCKVEARTITFVSASEAVVKFYDNDANDYAETTVTVTVEERRKLDSTDDSYRHVAYRLNAEVSGANIAVTCDNEASFVDNYSDGTTENENVNYTVVNNFSYVVPTFVVNNMSNMLGQSFSFNNGTAVIEGKNVSISLANRQVSAIMHNGQDYRANAPICEVVPVSITITSATTATIRFEDKNNSSDYSEAVITINIIEAEDLNGEVLGAWITDAYQGRALTSTDLHVLTNNNGVYTVYSRPVNSNTWTATEISSVNAMTLMEAGKAPAWVWNGGSYEIGVLSYITANKASTGYVISYHSFGGVLMNILGDAEAALNGVPFAEPLKATGSQNAGMWTISYGGFTWYFI